MPVHARDYSLNGPENARAVEKGLANAEWYKTPVPRKRMKELMQRSDQPATRDTLIWLGLMLVCGGLGVYFWGSWLAIPCFLIYGVLYGSGSDSRWHECSHGTAFKTAWKNEAVYQLACFMMMRNPVTWKWSHSRHHTDTIIVGRDYEIITGRPPDLRKLFLNLFGLLDVPQALARMFLHARGKLDPQEMDFVPESEQAKVAQAARIWLGIYALVILMALLLHSILPLMLIGLPRLYGAWHHVVTGIIQHLGLAEDVLDHRLNSRTCYMNPVSRFIYWNMNYHLEHHMFPMVPYHRLPELHAEIRSDCPPPYPDMLTAFREIWPTFMRQLKDPEYFVKRPLPDTGRTDMETPRPVVQARA